MPRRPRALAAALALLVACRPPPGATKPPCDRPLIADLVVDAAATVNPGHDGEAWPTHVRVYQLSGAPMLETIDPAGLTEEGADAEIFGDLVIERQERVIYPDAHERWPLTVADGATHVAVVALFHRPAGDGWAVVIELPRGREGLCASPPPGPLCVFAALERTSLRAGALPPPGFVGDGQPCTPLAILGGAIEAAEGDEDAGAPAIPDAPKPPAPKPPAAPKPPSALP